MTNSPTRTVVPEALRLFLLISFYSLFFTICHALSVGTFSSLLFLYGIVVFLISNSIGILILNLILPKPQICVLTALLLGMVVLSILLLLLAFLSPFSIHINFIAVAVIASGLLFKQQRRNCLAPFKLSSESSFAFLVTLLGSWIWSQENIFALSFTAQNVIIRPWQDIFYHASQISLFAQSEGAHTLQSFMMSGTKVPPYHYAGYMISAVLSRLTGLDSFSFATSMLSPLAMTWTGFGAYWFGKNLKLNSYGSFAGLGGVVAIMIVPDAASYLLGNAWTSYYFFQTVAMGGAFAIGTLGLALGFIFLGIRDRSYPPLLTGIFLIAASSMFKIQIPLVYALPLIVFALIFFQRESLLKRTIVGLFAISAYGIAVHFSQLVPKAPTLALSLAGASMNVNTIINNYAESIQISINNFFQSQDNFVRNYLLGIPLVLLATYGIWNLILIFLLRICFRRKVLKWIPLCPLFFILVHLIIALGLDYNRGYGDPFEVYHKTFVWPYFVVCSWAGAVGIQLAYERFFSPKVPNKFALKLLTTVVVFVAFTAWGVSRGRSVQSSMQWSKTAMNLNMPLGLYNCATFLRLNSDRSDVIQISENDDYLMLAAFSERKSFILHSKVNAGLPSEAQQARFKFVSSLFTNFDVPTAMKQAQASGIAWLISSPQDPDHWKNSAKSFKIFESSGYAVYRTKLTL